MVEQPKTFPAAKNLAISNKFGNSGKKISSSEQFELHHNLFLANCLAFETTP